MALTPHEMTFFRDKGYILKKGLFSEKLIRDLSKECEGLHEKLAVGSHPDLHLSWEEGLSPDKPKRIRQLMNSEKVSPLIDRISRSEEVLSVMEQLIGPELYLFHSKLMMKAARDGTFTPWHQDWGYWQHECKEPSQVNCMLAIDPADLENGCLRMVEGSQKKGLVPHSHFKTQSFSIGLEGDLSAYPARPIPMDPGDAIFFGPLIIHGSGPNESGRDRRANTMAFDKPHNRLKGEYPAQNHRWGKLS